MLKKSSEKPVRNRIDLSTRELARHWCKHFGVSQEDLNLRWRRWGTTSKLLGKN